MNKTIDNIFLKKNINNHTTDLVIENRKITFYLS